MDDIVEARPRRAYATGLVAAGLVAGVVVAGVSVAGAQTTPDPTPSASAPAPGVPGKPGKPGTERKEGKRLEHGGRHGHGGLKDGLRGALHGEFTTRAPGGGYQTMATQLGEATAVSATSITVRSEDGFSRTYAVDDGTLVGAGDEGLADVKTGDRVHVLALVTGGTAKAVRVVDVTEVKRLKDRWHPERPKPTPTS
jgi:hypothetical protein